MYTEDFYPKHVPPIKDDLRSLVDQFGITGIMSALIVIAKDKQKEIMKEWDGDPRIIAWNQTESHLIW